MDIGFCLITCRLHHPSGKAAAGLPVAPFSFPASGKWHSLGLESKLFSIVFHCSKEKRGGEKSVFSPCMVLSITKRSVTLKAFSFFHYTVSAGTLYSTALSQRSLLYGDIKNELIGMLGVLQDLFLSPSLRCSSQGSTPQHGGQQD